MHEDLQVFTFFRYCTSFSSQNYAEKQNKHMIIYSACYFSEKSVNTRVLFHEYVRACVGEIEIDY